MTPKNSARHASQLAAVFHEADRPGLHALLAPDKAQALGGGCLEADASQVKAHGVRHVLPHLLAVGGELWGLRANGAVAVQDAVASAADELGYAGEQLDADPSAERVFIKIARSSPISLAKAAAQSV